MPTAAIRMGDPHVVHSCGDCKVDVPMGSRSIACRFYVMDTEAFNFVLATDFFVEHSKILSLTLQAPYFLQVDNGDGEESVPLEQSEHTSSYLRVCKKEPSNMMVASKTDDYQLLGDVLDQGLKELGYSREDLNVKLSPATSNMSWTSTAATGTFLLQVLLAPFRDGLREPHLQSTGEGLDQGGRGTFPYGPVFPRLESPWGSEYWRTLLDKLTPTSVQLPDDAIYVPLSRKTPIGKPGWGGMLSVVDGGLAPVPWQDQHPAMVQEMQRESDSYTLSVLKDGLRPQDAVETIPGRDEYFLSDTKATNSPCHVRNPDVV